MKNLATAIATLALLALNFGSGTEDSQPAKTQPQPTATAAAAPITNPFKPCRQEDSNNCTWNASRQGDGQGTSFIALRKGEGVVYITHRAAQQLQTKTRNR